MHRRMTAIPLDPDELVRSHREDDQPPPGARALLLRLYGATVFHREHDLYVAEKGRGRHLQYAIRVRLRAQRFERHDAEEWAFRNWYRWLIPEGESFNEEIDPSLSSEVVKQALAYRETGIPNDEAFAWTIRGISAPDAVHLRNCGWNPQAYNTLLTRCFLLAPDVEDAAGWVESPIVWWRALRYLEAGSRLPEALDLETRRLAGEGIDAAIDLLIGLTAPPEVQ